MAIPVAKFDHIVIAARRGRQSDSYRPIVYCRAMNDTRHDRLRQARVMAGFGSAAAAARKHGWSVPTYRHHENGTAGYSPDQAAEYGKAFKIDPTWLLYGDGLDVGPGLKGAAESAGRAEAVTLRSSGKVQDNIGVKKGAHVDAVDIEVPGTSPDENHIVLEVVGAAMNKFYPDGSFVVIKKIDTMDLRLGDHVAWEITEGNFTETLMREIAYRGGEILLRAQSYDSRFHTDIPMFDWDFADDVKILGVVVGFIGRRDRDRLPVLSTVMRSKSD